MHDGGGVPAEEARLEELVRVLHQIAGDLELAFVASLGEFSELEFPGRVDLVDELHQLAGLDGVDVGKQDQALRLVTLNAIGLGLLGVDRAAIVHVAVHGLLG